MKKLRNVTPPISPIGLGCMGMSEFYGTSNDEASLKLLDKAYELDVIFWDTADTYGFGHNESLLGKWLHTREVRDELVIATKFGIVREEGNYKRHINNHPDYIRQACEASLKRLKTDYIDLYYCHRRNPDTPIEAMMETLSDLVKVGKIKAIGLSEVNADTIRKAHAIHPLTAVQSEYSLWTRDAEAEIIPVCQELGIEFVAYSPLGRAFLTGKLESLADNDFRQALPRFQNDAQAANQKLVDELTQLSNDWQTTNAQLCLAWILNKHPNVTPIAGTRREHYLLENIQSTDIRLNTNQISQLDQLFNADRITGKRYPDAGWAGIEK